MALRVSAVWLVRDLVSVRLWIVWYCSLYIGLSVSGIWMCRRRRSLSVL